MKAKLIKVKGEEDYILNWEGVGYVATYESTIPYKLSLKNCQAIERGYDLDELAKKIRGLMMISGTSKGTIDHPNTDKMISLFQKALEILGDKKFTEEDMVSAIVQARDVNELADVIHKRFRKGVDEIIDSLQQNEWEVEVEMMLAPKYYGYVPKLDADGCLILRRL